jgi:cytochrome c-type biogenesis protein CcmF
MIAELASASLALAALVSALLAWCGLIAVRGNAVSLLSRRLALSLAMLVGLAFLLLVCSYIQSDFSVANVAENSHTVKPLLYKITGSWGNHEGSMLLWVWILTLFAAAFAFRLPDGMQASQLYSVTLGVLGFVALGFILFVLLTSNPFVRLNPPPIEGQDLNPLLQDIGLAIHPPLLYLGYVGFAVVFALAVAVLACAQPVNAAWARKVQPWALLAWSFLTAGIGLGSWWAYRELGWGGWWFWDPVENVSLLPWLSGTALLHCLFVMGRRPVLQNWTLLLTISTFTFSLLGTFLVRSGLLTSVHSFASDPTRGLYILAFVALVTGGSLWLYALRYPRSGVPDFEPVSREGGVMLNNLLLVTLCATVFLGIIYPLLMQVLDMPSVSVGAPYYNTVVVPLAIPLLLMAGFGPLLSWKAVAWPALRRPFRQALWLAVVLSVAMLVLQWGYWRSLLHLPFALAAAIAGLWMLAGTLAYTLRLRRNNALKLADSGVLLAHGGLAVFVIAASLASAGRMELEQPLAVGERLELGGYVFTLAALHEAPYKNYIRKQAEVQVAAADGGEAFALYPESRFYPSRGMETAESSINGGPRRDVYTAIATMADLGNSTGSGGSVVLRVYIIPAMWWLWLGFIAVTTGGFLSALRCFASKNN